MTSQWYKAGPKASWRGRVEVVGNHTRIYYPHWPSQNDRDMRAIDSRYVSSNVGTGWWAVIDTDLEMDLGL
jgi:hypothetical protein